MPDRTPDGQRRELLPAESMALTVASAQLQRGENPTINVTTVLVMALERLTEPEEPMRTDAEYDESDGHA